MIPSTRTGAPSLRRQLLTGIMTTVLLIGILSGVGSYWSTREQVEELFDAEMAQLARTLQSIFVSHPDFAQTYRAGQLPLIYEDGEEFRLPSEESRGTLLPDLDWSGEATHEIAGTQHRYEKKLAYQVWNPEGHLLIQTRSAEALNLGTLQPGFHDIALGDTEWRVFSLVDAGQGFRIQVAQREDVRSELTLEIALNSLVLPLAVVPLLGGLLWGLVTRRLFPLNALSQSVEQREPLDANPLAAPEAPGEVQPLIHALNGLFTRVREQAEREKQFTADAAHELRTPLAAMKINLQNARRRSQETATIQSLTRAEAALERMVQLVEQLLSLSRLESASHEAPFETTRLYPMLDSVLEELKPLMQARRQQLTVDLPMDYTVRAQPAALSSLLGNLLSNAVKYSAREGHIRIALEGNRLQIIDSGPGVPNADIGRLCERFYRVGGDSADPVASDPEAPAGTGLGLSIAARVAALHGFGLSFANRQDGHTGLVVTLDFKNA